MSVVVIYHIVPDGFLTMGNYRIWHFIDLDMDNRQDKAMRASENPPKGVTEELKGSYGGRRMRQRYCTR